jgi:hypothetical protein
MDRLLLAGTLLVAVSGCAAPAYQGAFPEAAPALYANPTFAAATNHECLWETVVDVVDDYFRIKSEEPVRACGAVVTEGQLDTFFEVGSTLFEPWRHDSANAYEKLESTLQSIRRRAVVRVIPADRGFWIDVAVFKELEDVVTPYPGTAGSATFSHSASLNRVINPVSEQEINDGWIPLGRDTALEQRLLQDILARLGAGAAAR